MATFNLSTYSSYISDTVSGGTTPEGLIRIDAGNLSLFLSREEWRRIRSEVENGRSPEAIS